MSINLLQLWPNWSGIPFSCTVILSDVMNNDAEPFVQYRVPGLLTRSRGDQAPGDDINMISQAQNESFRQQWMERSYARQKARERKDETPISWEDAISKGWQPEPKKSKTEEGEKVEMVKSSDEEDADMKSDCEDSEEGAKEEPPPWVAVEATRSQRSLEELLGPDFVAAQERRLKAFKILDQKGQKWTQKNRNALWPGTNEPKTTATPSDQVDPQRQLQSEADKLEAYQLRAAKATATRLANSGEIYAYPIAEGKKNSV